VPILIAAPLAYFLCVAGTRQLFDDGYYWTRWVDPAWLLLVAAAAVGFGAVLVPAHGDGSALTASRPRVAAAVIAAVALAASVPLAYRSFADRRDHLSSDARAIFALNVRTGRWIADNTPPDAVVGVRDAGAIRYFGRRTTIDLAGLNYAPLAFRRVQQLEVIERLGWIAVFPRLYQQTMLWSALTRGFVTRAAFEIPVEEYTPCPCPGQTQIIVAERTGGGPR
jgi:hypothetical protein